MAEKRIKLTQKQFDHYTTSRREAMELGAAFEQARTKLTSVSELILDFHGVDPAAQVQVDDRTKELVVLMPDENQTAEEPKKAKRRGKQKPEEAEAQPA